MRIMYVASQPQDGAMLNIGREIGQFQRRLLDRGLPDLQIHFCSDVSVERFRTEVATIKPDILHITAHSDDGKFRFRNERNDVVEVNGEDFSTILPDHALPKLAVFSSCDSSYVAAAMRGSIPAVVGFDGRVESDVAFLIALQLYEDLLEGKTIQSAFVGASRRTSLEQPDGLQLALHGEPTYLASTVLYRPPAMVARVVGKSKSSFMVEVGLDGAPSDLIQVVFFTDEREWAPDDDYGEREELPLECWRASRMAKIVYGPLGVGRCAWSSTPEEQDADERLYAVALRSTGAAFVVPSTVSSAIKTACDRGLVAEKDQGLALNAAESLKVWARTKSFQQR